MRLRTNKHGVHGPVFSFRMWSYHTPIACTSHILTSNLDLAHIRQHHTTTLGASKVNMELIRERTLCLFCLPSWATLQMHSVTVSHGTSYLALLLVLFTISIGRGCQSNSARWYRCDCLPRRRELLLHANLIGSAIILLQTYIGLSLNVDVDF